MSNLSHWSQSSGRYPLRQILNLQSNSLASTSSKFRKDDTTRAIIDLIRSYDEVSVATFINSTNLYVDILITTTANEIYRINCKRPNVSDHKNLNDWICAFVDNYAFVSRIDNKLIWL